MSKKIEDYLHLYLGCRVVIAEEKYKGGGLKLIGICDMGCQVRDEGVKITFYVNELDVKLVLRPLTSMTQEECIYIRWPFPVEKNSLQNSIYYRMNAYEVSWLLSKHFDLFGLIDAGLAVTTNAQTT